MAVTDVVRDHHLVLGLAAAQRVYRLATGPSFEQEAIAMFAAAGMRTDSLERICEAPEKGCTVYGEKGDIFVNATVIEVADDAVTVVLQAT